MKKNWILLVGIALLLVAAVLMVNSASNQPKVTAIQNTTQPAARTFNQRHGQRCSGTL
jgi:predicted transglutaminase-like cysteine proteinase